MPAGILAALGMKAAEGALNQGLNAVGMGIQQGMNKQALKRQEEANKRMMDYNNQKQLEMWNATNYEAQMGHLKAAGLNPGLMYGMGGGGGATTGGGGTPSVGANMVNAPGVQSMDIAQLMLMKAQKENIEASTAKMQAETTKTGGVDTEEAKSRIAQLAATTTNEIAKKALIEADTTAKNIQNYETLASQEDRLEYIEYQTKRAITDFENAANTTFINKTTRDSTIIEIQAKAIGAVLHNEAIKAGITLTKAQAWKIGQEIAQGWKSLEQTDTKNATEKFKATTEANSPGLLQVIGREANSAIENIYKLFGTQRRSY